MNKYRFRLKVTKDYKHNKRAQIEFYKPSDPNGLFYFNGEFDNEGKPLFEFDLNQFLNQIEGKSRGEILVEIEKKEDTLEERRKDFEEDMAEMSRTIRNLETYGHKHR